ncbi:MAG: DUF5107 domain-containing protein [Anaerolineae bacterium]|nr:DUF5107 domain-containing protein [Anaerolineae bacterium]
MPSAVVSRSGIFRNWNALYLENAHVCVVVIPQLGGKIVSIQSRASGREFLWQDETRPYRSQRYGDEFGNYDISGFDECFPSIGACNYPDYPWADVAIPDHGELWCIPWQSELTDSTIYVHAYGIHFPYHFEKWITLGSDAASFEISYRISNLSPFEFKYLWSAHPLFAAQEGMRIVLPSDPEVRFAFALGNRISGEFLQKYRWSMLPEPSGGLVDYSLIGSVALDANDKVYANAPAEGWCALHEPQSGDFLAILFSPEKTPFVGICIDHGGWPFEGIPGYWVALEPCTGCPDRLDQAIAGDEHKTLAGYGSAEWSLRVHLGQADSAETISQIMMEQGRRVG